MIQVGRITIPENEITLEFVRSSGPGGQNVNKVASAVQLRFDIANSPSLPARVRKRLIELGGNRVTQDGVLILDARESRSQDRNRKDAVERLRQLVHEASKKPKVRKRTRPTRASKERRLQAKKQRAEKKRS